MIPKIIHYCWFGNDKIPSHLQKYMETWKKILPDYMFICWNINNYDVNKSKFTKEAFSKKQFAFLSDYVRLDVVFRYGGIYLDTDVEVIKSFDYLLEEKMFIGREEDNTVNTGQGFGAILGFPFLKKVMDYYDDNADLFFEHKPKTCVEIITSMLLNYGLESRDIYQHVNEIFILKKEVLCPITLGCRKPKITSDTISIHHFDASWYKGNRFVRNVKYRLIPLKKFIKKFIK